MYERDQNIRMNVTFLDLLNIQYISDNYNAMYFVWHNNEAFKKIIITLHNSRIGLNAFYPGTIWPIKSNLI